MVTIQSCTDRGKLTEPFREIMVKLTAWVDSYYYYYYYYNYYYSKASLESNRAIAQCVSVTLPSLEPVRLDL